jgi:uncharacterized membrane protein
MRGNGRWNRLRERLSRLTRAEVEHIVFWTVVVLKTADALLEVLGGVILIFISAAAINRVVHGLVRPELVEDPGDLIVHYILKYLGHVSPASKAFAVLYLLIHGAVKLVVVGALWLKQLWAYPLAGVIFAGFIVYQMVRFACTLSIWMIALSVLDLILIALLPREYHRAKYMIHLHDKRP